MSPSSVASRPSSASFKAFAWFERRIVPALRHIGELPALLAIRESLPWSFIGLLAALPLFMALAHPAPGAASVSLAQRLSLAELPAFAIMGAVLAIVLAFRLALHLRLSRRLLVPATAISFIFALPRPFTSAQPIAYLHRAGETGLFLAILVALCMAGAYKYWRWYGLISLVAIFALLFALHVSAANGLEAALGPLGRLGDTYAALMIIVFVEMLLWIVGVHGPATLAAIVTPVYLTLQFQNTAAHAHHQPLPHIVVVSLFLFIFPGGSGATLPLAVSLLFARAKRLRSVGRATILPAIFNINEPLLFGLPVVANPYLALPFVIAPLVTATITYFAFAHDLVGKPIWYYPSMIPAPISTYLATLDPRAVLLLLLNVGIAALIYAPFVYVYDRHESTKTTA